MRSRLPLTLGAFGAGLAAWWGAAALDASEAHADGGLLGGGDSGAPGGLGELVGEVTGLAVPLPQAASPLPAQGGAPDPDPAPKPGPGRPEPPPSSAAKATPAVKQLPANRPGSSLPVAGKLLDSVVPGADSVPSPKSGSHGRAQGPASPSAEPPATPLEGLFGGAVPALEPVLEVPGRLADALATSAIPQTTRPLKPTATTDDPAATDAVTRGVDALLASVGGPVLQAPSQLASPILEGAARDLLETSAPVALDMDIAALTGDGEFIELRIDAELFDGSPLPILPTVSLNPNLTIGPGAFEGLAALAVLEPVVPLQGISQSFEPAGGDSSAPAGQTVTPGSPDSTAQAPEDTISGPRPAPSTLPGLNLPAVRIRWPAELPLQPPFAIESPRTKAPTGQAPPRKPTSAKPAGQPVAYEVPAGADLPTAVTGSGRRAESAGPIEFAYEESSSTTSSGSPAWNPASFADSLPGLRLPAIPSSSVSSFSTSASPGGALAAALAVGVILSVSWRVRFEWLVPPSLAYTPEVPPG